MYEWKNIDYGQAGSLVHDRDPRKFSWGYFAHDTIPQSGIGLFFWFESPAELLDFVVNVETHILSNSEKVKQELKQIIKGYNVNRGLTKNLREQINSKLGDIEIQWWGDFSDLRSGRSKFSKEIIIAFVNSLPEDKKDGTATIKHVNEFIEFCKLWGH